MMSYPNKSHDTPSMKRKNNPVSPASDPLGAGAGAGKALAADAGALAEGGLGGVNLGAPKASEDSSRCKLNALEMQIECLRDVTA